MKLNEFKSRVEADFLSCFNQCSDGHSDYLHWHPHYETLIVYSSGRYKLVNNSVAISGEGSAVFIHAPYTLHVMQVEPGHVYDQLQAAVPVRAFREQTRFFHTDVKKPDMYEAISG